MLSLARVLSPISLPTVNLTQGCKEAFGLVWVMRVLMLPSKPAETSGGNQCLQALGNKATM